MRYKLSTEMTWARTRGQLEETFRKWGVNDWNIIANVTPTRAHNSYQSETQRTVTLRYTHPSGREVRLTMDRQYRAVDNLRVLYLALEAMRLNESRGLGETIQEAYLQLAGPAAYRDPYEILGVRPDTDMAIIEAAYRIAAKRVHSDVNDESDEPMKELNDALERIKAERNSA